MFRELAKQQTCWFGLLGSAMLKKKMENSAKLMHFDQPIVKLQIFEENRARLLAELRKVVTNPATFILMEGGKEINHHNTDLVEGDSMVFRQESYFFWTFGVIEPGFYGAINVHSGETYLFAPEVESKRDIWLGKLPTLEEIKQHYGVTEAFYDDRIAEKLSTLGCRSVLTLIGQNTDSELELLEPDVNLTSRVFKTDRELELIRYACKVTCQAHIQLVSIFCVFLRKMSTYRIHMHCSKWSEWRNFTLRSRSEAKQSYYEKR
ncbi:Xaa-Pro dipeptidase [Trichinella pseudospiralis]|uniref:Xaa-Pro dipeptidase n=1 Tax=Trichinella pseudospiralis TaxID=6337 RepID=A0A0V0XFL9_TRIPS|nr:Xaa-Pro dipeptidase [Trichinella pseudospiralis]